MKEYEFVVEMTESLFVYELISTICAESLYGTSYDDFYEEMFKEYLEYRDKYRKALNRGKVNDIVKESREKWNEKKEEIYELFLNDMRKVIEEPDIEEFVNNIKESYEEEINKDDRDAFIHDALKYPYIVKQVREELSIREGVE